MNLFQLVFKQMRQRALSTWLTLLSVLLGVGLAIAILILYQQSEKLFGQKDFGYDMIVGVKGSPLVLTLNTVYHMDQSQGNIKYSVYDQLMKNPQTRRLIRMAIPRCVGDSYMGQRIIGTTNEFFGYSPDGQTRLPDGKRFEYLPGQSFEIATGRMMHQEKFEAIIGSDVSRLTGLKIGDTFQATHGMPSPNQTPDIHPEKWTVVGILAPTHTANDRCLWIGMTSFYTIFEHAEGELDRAALRAEEEGSSGHDHGAANQSPAEKSPAAGASDTAIHTSAPSPTGSNADGHDQAAATGSEVADHDHDADHEADHDPDHAGTGQEAGHQHHHDEAHYTLTPDGIIHLDADVMAARELSAILIKTTGGGFAVLSLKYFIGLIPDVMAINPAEVMVQFFETFFKGSTLILLIISALVVIVATFGIMTTIYNSVAARRKEIAILRALGATRGRILSLICLEATLIGLIGSLLGLVAAHISCAIAAVYIQQHLGQQVDRLVINPMEFVFLGGVVVVSALAGLVPALKVYQTPVASNLVAS